MRRKPIFDLVRKLLGRRFRQAEVDALDAAIDRLERAGPYDPPRAIGPAGLALIRHFEGCARRRPDGLIEAYPDPGTGGDPWTIGWGATGAGIGPQTVWTQEQCDDRLSRDLRRYAADVTAAIGDAPTSQAQFDALVSFHYNTGAIGRATLARRHREGRFEEAATEFARWKFAGNRPMNGLLRRRQAEAVLYRSSEPAGAPVGCTLG